MWQLNWRTKYSGGSALKRTRAKPKRHRKSRLRGGDRTEFTISLIPPPSRVGNIRSVRVVPDDAEQTNQALPWPIMPSTLPEKTHEKQILHARVHGEVEDMQQTADAKRTYDARGKHQGVCDIVHPSLLLLLIASTFVPPCSY